MVVGGGRQKSKLPHLNFEKSLREEGFFYVAGADEVGRGCLAGPVVAAAVILPDAFVHPLINDSKKLTHAQRERCFEDITSSAVSIGVGLIDSIEIDAINIFHASQKAMVIALNQLNPLADYVLVDGKFPLDIATPQRPIIKGDSISLSIAAASIIAKVTRDRMMVELQNLYSQFTFSVHKGYPTVNHRMELQNNGPTPIHRRSFRGVVDGDEKQVEKDLP